MTHHELPSEPGHPQDAADGFEHGPWVWEIIRHAGCNGYSVRLTYEDPDYVNDSTMVIPAEDLETLVDCLVQLLERVGINHGLRLRLHGAGGSVSMAPSSN